MRLSFCFLFFVVLIFSGCKKQRPVACFDHREKAFLLRYQFFESCSENTDYVFWVFGDGNGNDGRSVRHRYDKPGTYEVQLKAYSDDGNIVDIKKQDLTLTYKVVDSVVVDFLRFSGTRKLEFGVHGKGAVESHVVSMADFPITYTFSESVLIDEPTSYFGIFDPVKKESLVSANNFRFHADYTNPQVVTSGALKMKIYWHFKN